MTKAWGQLQKPDGRTSLAAVGAEDGPIREHYTVAHLQSFRGDSICHPDVFAAEHSDLLRGVGCSSKGTAKLYWYLVQESWATVLALGAPSRPANKRLCLAAKLSC